MRKICNKCNNEKDINEYSPNKLGKFGLKSICKKCDNKRSHLYKEKHRVEIRKKSMFYYAKNKDEINNKHKIRYSKDSTTKKKYFKNNKEKIYGRLRLKRNQPDSISNFRSRCCSSLKRTLKYFNSPKSGTTQTLLGYSPSQLKEHLIKHPNWNLISDKSWSVDHIFPIKAFYDYNIFDIKLVNSLENLQPMLKSENSSKQHKYKKDEFERFLKKHGFLIKR